MPMKPEDLDKNGLVQWPQVMGGVVLVVNLQGIKPGQLKLDGKTVAGMYLGTIAKWNDPAVAALNPGATLPTKAAPTVHPPHRPAPHSLFHHHRAPSSPA